MIGYPLEVAVVRGDYSVQNISLVARSVLQYVCFGDINVDHVVFQPDSDMANITGTGPAPNLNQTLGPMSQKLSFSTDGYWNLTSLAREQAIDIPIIGPSDNPVPATVFVPGTYTVAVEDEWGQALVLHFVVQGPTPSTTYSSSSYASSTTSTKTGLASSASLPSSYALQFAIATGVILLAALAATRAGNYRIRSKTSILGQN